MNYDELWHIRTYQSLRGGAAACCGCKAIGTRYKFQTACDGFASPASSFIDSLVSTWSASLFRAQLIDTSIMSKVAAMCLGLETQAWCALAPLPPPGSLHISEMFAQSTLKKSSRQPSCKISIQPSDGQRSGMVQRFCSFHGIALPQERRGRSDSLLIQKNDEDTQEKNQKEEHQYYDYHEHVKVKVVSSWWDNSDKAIKHFQIMPNNQKKPIKCPRFPPETVTVKHLVGCHRRYISYRWIAIRSQKSENILHLSILSL